MKIFIIVVCLFSTLFAAEKYQIVDIRPSNDMSILHLAINELGECAGSYYDTATYPTRTIFFWDAVDGMKDLGVLPNASQFHLNNNHHIVFESHDVRADGIYQGSHIYAWDENNGLQSIVKTYGAIRIFSFTDSEKVVYQVNGQLFLWEKGESRAIAHYLEAKTNARDELFGFSMFPEAGEEPVFGDVTFKYSKSDGSCEEVLSFHGVCLAFDFNNKGVAAGTIHIKQNQIYGFTWSGEKGIQLFNDFFPSHINDDGVMTGCQNVPWDYRYIKRNGAVFAIDTALESSPEWGKVGHIGAINTECEMVASAINQQGNCTHIIIAPI